MRKAQDDEIMHGRRLSGRRRRSPGSWWRSGESGKGSSAAHDAMSSLRTPKRPRSPTRQHEAGSSDSCHGDIDPHRSHMPGRPSAVKKRHYFASKGDESDPERVNYGDRAEVHAAQDEDGLVADKEEEYDKVSDGIDAHAARSHARGERRRSTRSNHDDSRRGAHVDEQSSRLRKDVQRKIADPAKGLPSSTADDESSRGSFDRPAAAVSAVSPDTSAKELTATRKRIRTGAAFEKSLKGIGSRRSDGNLDSREEREDGAGVSHERAGHSQMREPCGHDLDLGRGDGDAAGEVRARSWKKRRIAKVPPNPGSGAQAKAQSPRCDVRKMQSGHKESSDNNEVNSLQNDGVATRGAPEHPRNTHGLAFAREKELKFLQVQAAEGNVAVANALCVNSSYTGELRVPPMTDTGAQRALKGDEIFYVHKGQVRLEIDDHRYILREGDHVAIPHLACYSFYNSGTLDCRLIFFVPRNPFG